MSVVGDNIRALRTLYGNGRDLTQTELAEIIGVTRETVNKWEAGSIGNVRTSNINRLREYFGLTVDDLRSETNGLAAQLIARREVEIQGHATATLSEDLFSVPLVSLADLRDCAKASNKAQKVEVPPSLASKHRLLYACVLTDDSMAMTLPKGCHVFVDLNVEPQTGSIVVASVPKVTSDPLVRRLHRGATKAMLSAEGYENKEDIVLEFSDMDVIGTVVWYQAAKELA